MAKVIETRDLAVAFGKGDSLNIIFQHLDIGVEEGEFVTLVGVSGAGKSTLLRVIADLIPAYEGSVKVETEANSARRPIAMVFQAALLMPWRKINDNVALGLEGIEVPDQIRRERVERTLALVGLSDYGDRWPYQLSGGQRQRIGIARALAVEPDILLMDEPFGALDAITRTALQDELLRIWRETRKSILFVTHDIEEAVYLGDRVLLLGDQPAHIVSEYPISIERAERRESQAFLRKVEEVKAGLERAIELTNGGGAGA
jgi:NitT/TauT family transport system ATP-binding protein